MDKNIVHTNARHRHYLPRLAAAVAVGAALLLGGCSSPDSPKKSLFGIGTNERDESIRKKAQSDSFPSAKQAGLWNSSGAK